MATSIQFTKAVKRDAKGRVALIGPAGSGKSYTMLTLARLLAGPHGKIAAIDSEHGSLSKYADIFDFDVFEMDSFTPQNFLGAIEAAEQARYDVFCCDSLSHFWVGRDGALEYVDMAAKRSSSRDGMAGWKEFRPHEREMVDRMIATPLHVICTMRTKTAYEDQVNERGKKVRVKIGLAPVQREGLEYEFDLVGAMDDENNLVIDKTRCPHYSGKVLSKPAAKDFEPFREWLKGSTGSTPLTNHTSGRSSTPGTPPTASSSGQTDARQSAGTTREIPPPPTPGPAETVDPTVPPEVRKLWREMGTTGASISKVFARMKREFEELLGESGLNLYAQVLEGCGLRNLRDLRDLRQARDLAQKLWMAIEAEKETIRRIQAEEATRAAQQMAAKDSGLSAEESANREDWVPEFEFGPTKSPKEAAYAND
jgi:energy-coupling factor transporter ATP-binding protein EcfA2